MFWEHLYYNHEGRQLWDLHPLLRTSTPADMKYILPCVVHADAGPFTRGSRESCDIIDWSSILGVGTEIEVKMPFATELKQSKANRCSARPAWEVLFSSFVGLGAGAKAGAA